MSAAALIIDFRGMIGSTAARSVFICDTGDLAREVQSKLADAAKAYHDRANDRERLVTFETSSGPATVDISDVAAIGVDDPMGRARHATESWNAACARLKGLAEAAKRAAAAIEAGTGETEGLDPKGESAVPKADAKPSSSEQLRQMEGEQ